MKKTNCLFTLWVAALCAGTYAYAVGTAPAILSNYGEIQSVKNYSSNPFWNKNSPYNQNFPKPIYATGADLNTGDCNRVVENLVTSYCAEHNYCRNLRISDVRPTIMVQLSQLPGHNFATSCGGYIDSAFDKFQKEYGNVSTVNLPKPASQPTNIEIANPFAPKQTAAQKAIADRTAELEKLQSITTPTAGVHAEYFPKTTADLSFTDRIANTAAGLEPYKDKASYKKPDFLGEDEAFFERLKNQNFEEYCERRPNDPECVKWYCEQHPDDEKCKKTTQTQPIDPTPPVNPPATGCPEIADHRDPKTCKCYPSDFMDSADCNCRGLSKWDATKKKCVCPITDTSNLSIDEWGYTTTMCDCRYNQIHNKYNSTKGMCEEGDTTPPPTDGKYALLQCRSETIPNYDMLGDGSGNMSDPFRELECKRNTPRSLHKCFTRCMSNYDKESSPGFVNKELESVLATKFCSGYFTSSGMFAEPVGFFSYADAPRMLASSTSLKIMTFNKNEVDAIKDALSKVAKRDWYEYCYTDEHKYWLVYILKQNSNGTYKVAEKPVILYHD